MNKTKLLLLSFCISILAINNQISASSEPRRFETPEGTYKSTCINIMAHEWDEESGCALKTDCLKYDHKTYHHDDVVIRKANSKFEKKGGSLREH